MQVAIFIATKGGFMALEVPRRPGETDEQYKNRLASLSKQLPLMPFGMNAALPRGVASAIERLMARGPLQEVFNVGGSNWFTANPAIPPTTSGLNTAAGRTADIFRTFVTPQQWSEAKTLAQTTNIARGTGTFENAAEGLFASRPANLQQFAGTLDDWFNAANRGFRAAIGFLPSTSQPTLEPMAPPAGGGPSQLTPETRFLPLGARRPLSTQRTRPTTKPKPKPKLRPARGTASRRV